MSGLRYLAGEDPNYDEKYEVVGAFTDVPDAPGAEFVRERGLSLETNDLEDLLRRTRSLRRRPRYRHSSFRRSVWNALWRWKVVWT